MKRRAKRRSKETVVDRQYSVNEVADILGVGKTTVKELVAEGRQTQGRDGLFPTYIISSRVMRIPASAINAFLERCIL